MSRPQICFGGTCGSYESPHNRRSRLTTSLGIAWRKKIGIVVDHGSGIVNTVQFLTEAGVRAIIVLQTHPHNDHVHGLPMNRFYFQKKIPVLGVWSPQCCGKSFLDVWETAFNKANWPCRPEDTGFARPEFFTITGDMTIPILEDLVVTTLALNHPGGSLAYRIHDEKGDDIVIATDHEHGNAESDMQYAAFVNGAVLLVADAQYEPREYSGMVGVGREPPHSLRGWGHSTPSLLLNCISMCEQSPKKVLITHHEPTRTGPDMDRYNIALQALSEKFKKLNTTFVLANDGDKHALPY